MALALGTFADGTLAAQQQSPATPPVTTPAKQVPDAPPASGTVLFERHQAPDVPAIESAPAEAAPDPKPANRRSRRQGLQRRDSADATAASQETPADGKGAEPSGVSSSVETQAGAVQAERLPVLSEKGADAIPDADRRSVQITRTDLDVHLDRRTGQIAARARIALRNTGASALSHVVLQISSTLRWQTARIVGTTSTPLVFEQHRLTTDADHTGAAAEAALILPAPLPPDGALTLEVFYGGTLQANADRLIRLGAPAERAAQSDWDGVTENFTGLRGFGNVLWFPVSAAPAFLADGASFASAVDAQRALPQVLSLRLTAEGTDMGTAQAFFLGRSAPFITVSGLTDGPDLEGERTTIQTAEWPAALAASHPVSLFLEASQVFSGQGVVHVATDDAGAAEAYRTAASRVRPLLESWLGPRPAAELTVLDLPVANGQPFADGALLVLPVSAVDAKVLAGALVYPLASAWLSPDLPPWLREGLPEFLRLLYLEQTGGRDSLLAELNAGGGALAKEESFRTDGSSALAQCAGVTCARTKAAFVFNMLREIAGEQPLQQALTALLATGPEHAADGSANVAPRLLALLDKASGKDLGWFFQDWIERDKGLADLTIVSVAPRRVERSLRTDYLPSQRRPVGGPIGAEPVAQAGDPLKPEETSSTSEASRGRVAPAEGSWLVAVEVRNDGDAAAEVPVTVRSAGLQNTLSLRVPAHGRATVRVPFEAAPEEVWVNDGTTPEVRSVTHHKAIEMPVDVR